MDKFKLNVSTQHPSRYIDDEYETDKDNRNPYASVPYGCHKHGKNQSHQSHVNCTSYLQRYLKTTLCPCLWIANIINTSFKHGYVCGQPQRGILRPLLKSSKLDLLFPNFRPVSNLAYLGKLAKQFVSKHL